MRCAAIPVSSGNACQGRQSGGSRGRGKARAGFRKMRAGGSADAGIAAVQRRIGSFGRRAASRGTDDFRCARRSRQADRGDDELERKRKRRQHGQQRAFAAQGTKGARDGSHGSDHAGAGTRRPVGDRACNGSKAAWNCRRQTVMRFRSRPMPAGFPLLRSVRRVAPPFRSGVRRLESPPAGSRAGAPHRAVPA